MNTLAHGRSFPHHPGFRHDHDRAGGAGFLVVVLIVALLLSR